jgi:glycosyltransferase involved in cell wall biosynthesis
VNLVATNWMEILTFTTLFPNPVQPHHGVFVENRLRHLVTNGRVNARVVAPVPWFPFSAPVFGRYAVYARVVPRETRAELTIEHPKYFVLPKFGMSAAPALLAAASLPVLRRLQRERDFDLIDAHYFFPDGVAAIRLGRRLKKPVVITARGTDVNLIPELPGPRRMIQEAAREAAGIIAVSQALKDAIVGLGIPGERVTVLRNGVDLDLFQPHARDETRARLGLFGPTLLSVGHLIERKGHELVIGALPSLPDYRLLIAGDGPERVRLERLSHALKVENRVSFLGALPHEQLHKIYAAADALVLASSREGWPNVLLESMACGTPVVASNIWGNPEVVSRPEAGVLMGERSAAGVAEGVRRLFGALPARGATRRYAEEFSWDATSQGQLRLFNEILRRG